MSHVLKIVSQNMSINNGDVTQRYKDFCNCILTIEPDIVVVQEVSSDVGRSALDALAVRLGSNYRHIYDKAYAGQEHEQGLSIISRLPVVKNELVGSKIPGSKMQLVELSWYGRALAVVNIHLEAAPILERRRIRKFRYLAHYLRTNYGNADYIVAGDANSVPYSLGILLFKGRYGFKSAFERVHGKEPDYTFPALSGAELVDGLYIKHNQLRMLQHLAKVPTFMSKTHDGLPRYTTDYIFTNIGLSTVSAREIGLSEKHKAFSDHLGLHVSLTRRD